MVSVIQSVVNSKDEALAIIQKLITEWGIDREDVKF